ncbi:MAG: recombinase family protein [Roseibium sp.]|uniref:recombinase family protein n=1 Tax=Roseibium sp. TaxID=1936156 RepID=UPI003D9C30F2
MPQTAIIYARSANDDGHRFLSTQIGACNAHADQNGLSVRDILSEAKVSGLFSANRLGLSELFQRIGNGDIDTVICTSLDRLARDQKEAKEVLDRLTRSGVTLQSLGTSFLRSAGFADSVHALDIRSARRASKSLKVPVISPRT